MMKISKLFIFFNLIVFLSILLVSDVTSQIISISPDDTLYYGRIPEGKVAIRSISFYNLSSTSLAISDIRIEGPNAAVFSIVDDPGSLTLGLLEKYVMEIQFQPGSEGSFLGHFVVESNASTSPNNVDLLGEGTDIDGGFIAFERIFGKTKSDGASSVRVTSDGGYILAGSSRLIDREFSDATLIKTDKYGQIEWSQRYGIEDWSEGFAEAIPTLDGGYIAVGSKANSDDLLPPDIWIVKTDQSGSIVWELTIGDEESDRASYVIQTNDGGYLVAASIQYNTAQRQDVDVYLIKLDEDGNIAWDKKYGGASGEDVGCVQQTADGGYIFVGSTLSYGQGEYDGYLVKVDADGNEQWSRTYGGTDWDKTGKLILTDDGGYLLAGWTANFNAQARDVYLIKTDADGNEQWHKLFGDEHKDGASDVISTSDGGYLIVGSLENTFFSNYWRTDLYIIKTDGSGNELWSRTYGSYNDESASCVRPVDDGGYIISGSTNSYSNDREVYLLKIDRQGGFSPVTSTTNIAPQDFRLEQNYPNPFNSQTMIKYHLSKDTHIHLKIYNIRGQLVSIIVNKYQRSGSYNVLFNMNDLPSGLYFYQLKMDNISETKRMLFLK